MQNKGIITKTPLRLLLADDDGDIRARCRQALTARGHRVVTATDGDAAMAHLERTPHRPDLAIIDWQMPGLHGRSLLQAMNWRWPQIPVLVITAFSTESRAVDAVGYAAGYLRKPFTATDLVAEVDRLWSHCERRRHRASGGESRILRHGDLELHLDRLEVRVAGAAPVRLSPLEFALLACLLRHPGQVVSRKRAAAAIRPGRYTVMEASRALKHPLAGLRKKVEPDLRHPRYLRTRWGQGLTLLPYPTPA